MSTTTVTSALADFRPVIPEGGIKKAGKSVSFKKPIDDSGNAPELPRRSKPKKQDLNNVIRDGLNKDYSFNKEAVLQDPVIIKKRDDLILKIMRYQASPFFGPLLAAQGLGRLQLHHLSLMRLQEIHHKIKITLQTRKSGKIVDVGLKTALSVLETVMKRYGTDITGTNQILWHDREFLENVEEIKIECGIGGGDPLSNLTLKVLSTAMQVYVMNKALQRTGFPEQAVKEEEQDSDDEEEKKESDPKPETI